jgi:hypothetical protein
MDPSLFYSNGMWKPPPVYRRFTNFAIESPAPADTDGPGPSGTPGSIFKLLANDSKPDRMLMASETLNLRTAEIMELRRRGAGVAPPASGDRPPT